MIGLNEIKVKLVKTKVNAILGMKRLIFMNYYYSLKYW